MADAGPSCGEKTTTTTPTMCTVIGAKVVSLRWVAALYQLQFCCLRCVEENKLTSKSQKQSSQFTADGMMRLHRGHVRVSGSGGVRTISSIACHPSGDTKSAASSPYVTPCSSLRLFTPLADEADHGEVKLAYVLPDEPVF